MKCLRFDDGSSLPMLGLGTWNAPPGEVGAAVHAALRLGYRHIDCAAIYGNEAEIGTALSAAIDEGVVTREQLWITSKLWNNAHAPEAVEPALKQTLADLRLDHLDLYLIHWPVAFRPGVLMPESAEDLIALEELPIAATWAGPGSHRGSGAVPPHRGEQLRAGHPRGPAGSGPHPAGHEPDRAPPLPAAERDALLL